jgi:hypothetical protein
MNVSDVIDVLPAIFNKRTAAAITGLLGASIVMAYDATPPTPLAPLQVIGCPLAQQMNDDLIDQLKDVIERSNQGVELERPESAQLPGC